MMYNSDMLLKTIICCLASWSLIATGDIDNPAAGYTGTFYTGIDETGSAGVKYNKQATIKNVEGAKIKGTKKFDVEIDGKIYKLTYIGENKRGAKIFDNSGDVSRTKYIIAYRNSYDRLENSAIFRLFQKPNSEDYVTSAADTNGYIYGGELTQKVPESGQVNYEGGFQGSTNGKTDRTERSTFVGEVQLTVDFGAGTVSGSTQNLKVVSSTDFTQDLIDTDGKFVFSGGMNNEGMFNPIMRSDANLNTFLNLDNELSGEINGHFYGSNAAEFVGNAIVENDKRVGYFAFDSKKQ